MRGSTNGTILPVMRRLLGLLVLLYGLLLALNTTAPSFAELAGEKVSASLSGDASACTAPLGSPPFGGLYGNCPATWSGSESGRLFGSQVSDQLKAGTEVTAYKYPLLDDFAVLMPSNSDQVVGIIALLIIVLGILLLVAEKKRHRERSGEDDDHDSDDSDSDSSSSDSGGGSDGGGSSD